MDDLGKELKNLARTAALGEPVDPAVLWRQGRTRVRRRRAIGAMVTAAVVTVVGLGAVIVPEPVVVMPAGKVHAPGYPERVYLPSRWLASTSDEGPLGQLALISAAEHGDKFDVVGISATTGEYRFLDLPGRVEGSVVALAPNGKHVAYWTTGRTSKAPYPDPGLGADTGSHAIGGMAIYDTVTGRTQRTPIPTEHGLQNEALFWADSSTVWFGDWRLTDRHSATRASYRKVSVGDPRLDIINDGSGAMIDADRTADGWFLVAREDGLTFDATRPGQVATGTRPGTLRLPAKLPEKNTSSDGGPNYLYVSRTDTRAVVTVNATPSLQTPMMIGDVDAQGTVTNLTIAGDRFQDVVVLGWHDDHTLLAYGTDHLKSVLAEIDVNTGKVTTLAKTTRGWGSDIVPALDVLRGEPVTGLRPPDPIDPRLRTAGIAAGGLLLAGAALWIVRRRRRG